MSSGIFPPPLCPPVTLKPCWQQHPAVRREEGAAGVRGRKRAECPKAAPNGPFAGAQGHATRSTEPLEVFPLSTRNAPQLHENTRTCVGMSTSPGPARV